MKTNEIREGVSLKWKDDGQEFDVTLGLMASDHFWIHIENGDIIPILLTKQRLLKFKQIIKHEAYKNLYSMKTNHYNLPIHLHHNNCGILSMDNDLTTIQYVHQLQTFYFALTGKELIKK